jgi:hypothetical protein
MEKLWDLLIRLRTWVIGAVGLIALMLPEIVSLAAQLLNSPQITAVLPEGWKTWAGAIGFVALVWSRWRPATRTADPEVQVKQALKSADYGATVIVEAGGETKAKINA